MKNNTPQIAIITIIIVVLVAGLVYFLAAPKAAAPTTTASTTPATTVNKVTFSCDSGSMVATFASSTLMLALSDGRSFTMRQVESGSGIRYETGAGTADDIVFDSEGSNAFLTENGKTTYDNCVAGTTSAPSGGTGLNTFTDQGNTFTFSYPSSVTVSGGGIGYTQDWMTNATTSGLVLAKVTLPSTFEPKTNFQQATLTIGTSADPDALSECTTYSQSGGELTKSQVIINGVTYEKFVTNDAGAGNFYTTTSYRTIRNSQCYAIEYTVHTTDIGNYSPDQGISAYDAAKVDSVMDSVIQSFKFN
jgi:membrane-bound inhibitor of C-type lysozyme